MTCPAGLLTPAFAYLVKSEAELKPFFISSHFNQVYKHNLNIIILPVRAVGHIGRATKSAVQPALSLARCSAWCQESHPISPLSLLAVLRHVSIGCPLRRFHSGVQARAIFGLASVSSRRICSIQIDLLFLISLSICGISVGFCRSLFDITFGQ